MYFEMNLYEKFSKFCRLLWMTFAFPPNDITIEISTKCNESCGICYRFPLGIEEKVMPFDDFKKILDGLKTAFAGKDIRYLTFVGMGEVFCHDQVFDILRHTRRLLPLTGINVSTNLTCFNEGLMCSLIEGKMIDLLSVSIDDLIPTGGLYHTFTATLESNLEKVLRLRVDYNPALKLRVQAIIISREQVRRMIDMVKRSNIDILQLIRPDVHAFAKEANVGRIDCRTEKEIILFAKRYAKEQGVALRYNNSYNIPMRLVSRHDKKCLLADDHLFIDVNGNVLPCFYLRDYKIGNLVNGALKDVYRSEMKRDFYKSQEVLCQGCDVYKDQHHH